MSPIRTSRSLVLLLVFVLGGVLLFFLLNSGGEDLPKLDGGSGKGDVITPDTQQAAGLTAEKDGVGVRREAGLAEIGKGSCSIGGMVFSQTTGEPLANVEVLVQKRRAGALGLEGLFQNLFRNGLWRKSPRPMKAEVMASSRTDGAGRFLVEGVPSGRVWLELGEGFHYIRRSPSLRLSPGEKRTGVMLAAQTGGLVAGKLCDWQGQPVPGAVLDLRPGLNSFIGQFLGKGFRWRMAVSDKDGRFHISGVPPGKEYALSYYGENCPLQVRLDIEVAARARTDLELDGCRGASVSGRVENPEGQPVAGAKVALALLDLHKVLMSPEACPPVTTDRNGCFRLANIPPGEVAIAAAHGEQTVSPRLNLYCADGGQKEDVVLRIGEGLTLQGEVIDSKDQPVKGALVEVINGQRPESMDMGNFLTMRRLKTNSDKEGKFQLRGLLGKYVFLKVSHADYATRVMPRVKIKSSKKLQVKLLPKAMVSGFVLNKKTSMPLTRFAVRLRGFGFTGGEEKRSWEFEPEKGKFEIPGLPAREISLRFSATGFVTATRKVKVDPEKGYKGLMVLLEPEAIVTGTVVDAAGQPVPGARVSARRNWKEPSGELNIMEMQQRFRRGGRGQRSGPPWAREGGTRDGGMGMMFGRGGANGCLSGADGSFRLTGLAGGKWKLLASHPDHVRGESVDVEVSATQVTENIVLALRKGSAIFGQVTGLEGKPVKHAVVTGFSLKGILRSTVTDNMGNYRLENLLPSAYFIFKTRVEGRTTRNLAADLLGNMRMAQVRVKEGEDIRHDIKDRRAGGVDVEGKVLLAGKPLTDGLVTALTSSGDGPLGIGVRTAVVDKQGNYKLSSLKPGSYTFQVARRGSRPCTISVEVPAGAAVLHRDLDLPTLRIMGMVVDIGGEPIAGCRIRAIPKGSTGGGGLLGALISRSSWRTWSRKDGTFKLKQVPAGSYRIEVDPPRKRKDVGKMKQDDLYLDGSGDLTGLRLVLPPAATITGVVLDGRGQPVAGAEVKASRKEENNELVGDLKKLVGLRSPKTKTDTEGRFQLAGLSPGTWSVRSKKKDFAAASAGPLVLVQGQECKVELTMSGGGTVKVKVVNQTGSPIPRERIQVLDENDRPVTAEISAATLLRNLFGGGKKRDKGGWIVLKNIKPGSYTVVVKDRNGQVKKRKGLTVKEAAVVEFELTITE